MYEVPEQTIFQGLPVRRSQALSFFGLTATTGDRLSVQSLLRSAEQNRDVARREVAPAQPGQLTYGSGGIGSATLEPWTKRQTSGRYVRRFSSARAIPSRSLRWLREGMAPSHRSATTSADASPTGTNTAV